MKIINKIGLDSVNNGEHFYINIPLTTNFADVSFREQVDDKLVNVIKEESINEIVDYELIRFIPKGVNGETIKNIHYSINLLKDNQYVNTYDVIGITNDDLKYQKNSFRLSHLFYLIYDEVNPLTQSVITGGTLYCKLNVMDYLKSSNNQFLSIPKPANQVQMKIILNDETEGFNLYFYKDLLSIGEEKEYFIKFFFNNAKMGKQIGLMVKDDMFMIDELIKELYTKIILYRTEEGYFYKFDTTYRPVNNSNNVDYSNGNYVINLYEVRAT